MKNLVNLQKKNGKITDKLEYQPAYNEEFGKPSEKNGKSTKKKW